MAANRWHPALTVAQVLAVAGSSFGASIITAALVILELVSRRWRTAIGLVATVSLGALASTTIKLISERPRPIGGIANLTTFSFPSGHTTWAATVATALAIALPRAWSWCLAIAWIALMAWSRTYLGVHWLSDVAAGAVLGVSIALLVDGTLASLAGRIGWLARPPIRRSRR